MIQAVMKEPGVIEYRDVPIPEPNENEVLVKVKRIGVCGSDIHVYHGKHPYTSYPVVQGHEMSGVIEASGRNVKGFRKGDKITIEPQVSCGSCYSCRHGDYNICDNLKVIGFQTTGVASEFYKVSQDKLVKLPDDFEYNEGALIEPLAVAVRAVSKAGDIRDRKVVIFGAGPIGNLVAQTAKGMGADKTLIVDINDYRLKFAKDCGVDFVFNPKRTNLIEYIKEVYGKNEMADVIFECAGVPSTIESAIDVARKGSKIVIVGVFAEKVSIDMAKVNENELHLIGTARYVIDDFKRAINLVERKLVNLKKLVTNEFDFKDYIKAYEYIDKNYDKGVLKVVIKLGD